MNRKNLIIAGILFAVLLALGGLATYDERKTKSEKEADQTKNKVASLKADDVVEMNFTTRPTPDVDPQPGAPLPVPFSVSAVKKDGVWRLTKPVDALADGTTIDGLVRTVADYTFAKVVSESKGQWGEYGLADPVRQIELKTNGPQPQAVTIFLGNKAPIGYNVYLRTDGSDKSYLGSQHLLVSTNKTLADFRDKTLLKIDEAKIKTLTYLRQGEAPLEMTHAGSAYQIVKPEALAAEGTAVKEWVEGMNGVRVNAFDDAPSAALQELFKNPEFQINWTLENGEASSLKIVADGARLLAAFDPTKHVFGLPDDAKAKFAKSLMDFRNRRILESSMLLDTKAIKIDGDEFKNLDGTWYADSDAVRFDAAGKFKGPEADKPAEKANIRAFMVDLEFAKTDRFLTATDPAVIEMAKLPPLHRILLTPKDPKAAPLTIELYSAVGADDKYLVKRSGAPAIYRVARSAFNSMTAPKPGEPAAGEVKDEMPPLDPESGGAEPPSGKSSALPEAALFRHVG